MSGFAPLAAYHVRSLELSGSLSGVCLNYVSYFEAPLMSLPIPGLYPSSFISRFGRFFCWLVRVFSCPVACVCADRLFLLPVMCDLTAPDGLLV